MANPLEIVQLVLAIISTASSVVSAGTDATDLNSRKVVDGARELETQARKLAASLRDFATLPETLIALKESHYLLTALLGQLPAIIPPIRLAVQNLELGTASQQWSRSNLGDPMGQYRKCCELLRTMPTGASLDHDLSTKLTATEEVWKELDSALRRPTVVPSQATVANLLHLEDQVRLLLHAVDKVLQAELERLRKATAQLTSALERHP